MARQTDRRKWLFYFIYGDCLPTVSIVVIGIGIGTCHGRGLLGRESGTIGDYDAGRVFFLRLFRR
jgi:hypothetical protein